MIIATEIELFKDLLQYEQNGQHYDFHNDYNCEKVVLSESLLLIGLRKIADGAVLNIKFENASLTALEILGIKHAEGLTIDLFYRGRAIEKESLVDSSEDGRAYFYLEFYEGQKIEFWARQLEVCES